MISSGEGFSLMIEQTITFGNIVEIMVIAAGGISVFATMRTTVKNISIKVDGMQDEIKIALGALLQEWWLWRSSHRARDRSRLAARRRPLRAIPAQRMVRPTEEQGRRAVLLGC
jgi:hypothetical protein